MMNQRLSSSLLLIKPYKKAKEKFRWLWDWQWLLDKRQILLRKIDQLDSMKTNLLLCRIYCRNERINQKWGENIYKVCFSLRMTIQHIKKLGKVNNEKTTQFIIEKRSDQIPHQNENLMEICIEEPWHHLSISFLGLTRRHWWLLQQKCSHHTSVD